MIMLQAYISVLVPDSNNSIADALELLQPCINLSLPSAAHMCQWTRSALVHVMACHLFSTKPLPEPTLIYCQLDPQEQTSVQFKSK